MNSNLVEGYMNDITLGGKSGTVADDVATIRTLSSTLGLHLNAKKCELIQRCKITTEPAFRDFVITSKENATLLGAPLTDGPRSTKLWKPDAPTSEVPSGDSTCCRLTTPSYF